jgi:hypothetical protein
VAAPAGGASPTTSEAWTPASSLAGRTDNLTGLIEDVRRAALEADPGAPEPSSYHALRGRLEAARVSLPPAYRKAVYQPFVATLDELGPSGFALVLQRDPGRQGIALMLFDVAHAILQNAEGYERVATDAFQEVVSDLYDGFLGAADRRGVEPPDRGVLPPLVKWGNPDFGPYTWPVDATNEVFGLEAGVVSLPPANVRQGLLAWSALPHEVAGHDVLHADTGLEQELAAAVCERLKNEGLAALADYWAERIDETASDVLGILNMGPAAGLGLVGYFRGLNAAWGDGPRLRNDGPEGDSHPSDLLRGYLAAATVQHLRFAQRGDWAKLIEREVETDRDGDFLRLAGTQVRTEEARASAGFVAEVIATYRAAALEGHALGQIQNWRDTDEARVSRLGQCLRSGPVELPAPLANGTYAAHLVAAAIVAALAPGADVRQVHARMVRLLKQMHDANPSWGPMFVRHPGNAAPHRAWRSSVG